MTVNGSAAQRFNQDLTAFNTFGLPSRASALWRYSSMSELAGLSNVAKAHDRVFVLGGGSNVVLAPHLDSLVVKVESRGVRVHDESPDDWVIEAQAGEVWHDFVAHCIANGWHGLENLALIPGTVGAAPVQNIGAYGVELKDRFHSLQAWDMRGGCLVDMTPTDCRFSYRDSVFKQAPPGRWLIVSVRFRLPKQWRPVLDYPDLKRYFGESPLQVAPRQVFDAVSDIRRRKLPDPSRLGNVGSFFKNPVVSADRFHALKTRWPDLVAYPQENDTYKLAAGWLVERAGWKGRRLGSVGVHERQALVLVNYGGADAEAVADLANRVRGDVSARFGVELEQEPVAVH
ncbi:MAG TPA: UDP-N-acetylmuramate dehydrogenase [Burkholderiaceae bacterium]|nr:UDP-N-acetylmuramate dehydrogenase [Burkholderiaceae bacterium]